MFDRFFFFSSNMYVISRLLIVTTLTMRYLFIDLFVPPLLHHLITGMTIPNIKVES
jgi:hypothetical protein